ncbi:MAG TPA: glutathione S-transferase N-terminal domain-containing protein [Caulobacteraceae bacterium]|jgi:glutathione S-transferase/GST-like protein|nr:glutathione S-transferase N-terminal domain-containing protein [Caulobacteraceae bacterium]
MTQPIELHFWPTPNGRKISIALEEMELAYTLKPVNIGRGDQFKPEFLAISPNNRMPAIVDPDGPGRQPISVFESGAILQYLGRKTGRFYPTDERARVEVEEWLFWQVGGLGPMGGQANHFRAYAPSVIADTRYTAYGAARYTDEIDRLFGVMDRRLQDRDFLAGDYSIADMAVLPWALRYPAQGVQIDRFPRVQAWFDRTRARPAVQAGLKAGEELRGVALSDPGKDGDKAREVLFGQRARK